MLKQGNGYIEARLALEDGAVFCGVGFGRTHNLPAEPETPDRRAGTPNQPVTITGEVVFNTAMTGYQEALTDPSYRGQLLTMTAPLIGNYGVNEQDYESQSVAVAGFVIRELCRRPSNYRSNSDLSTWLDKAGVLGLTGIDTRALTRRLRTAGAMRGVLSTDAGLSDRRLVELARSSPSMSGSNLVREVDTIQSQDWRQGLGAWQASAEQCPDTPSAPDTGDARSLPTARKLRVVALDCGAKFNILRHLVERGCEVVILPFDASARQILDAQPDGLFVSNGPGDPAAVDATIATLREVAGRIPTFGICLGHQLLCLALGARTYKLKFGHRGANQPVKTLQTGRVEITSQNHGFAVDVDSIRAVGAEPTHIHLNDQTLAGFRHATKPIMAVQYHPEASPGPHDAAYLFDRFVAMMREHGDLRG